MLIFCKLSIPLVNLTYSLIFANYKKSGKYDEFVANFLKILLGRLYKALNCYGLRGCCKTRNGPAIARIPMNKSIMNERLK